MKIKIIKKKASSLKELSHEDIELEQIETLKDLLVQITIYEFYKQHTSKQELLTQDEINEQAQLGKITKIIEVMLQDYHDGLFRVFLNKEECGDLDEKLVFEEENEVVIIKLVMMAGRLW